MQTILLHQLEAWHFCLSAERTVFWEEEKVLIISDLHLGKTGHFRKAGIPVPQTVFKEDIQRLFSQLQYFNPQQMVVVGDFFHSSANKELELFKKWRDDIQMEIHLVKGNHDILKASWYSESFIKVHNEILSIKDISFIHDCNRITNTNESRYYFCGHVHPGISIKGMGKQSLSLPCFYFTKHYCILPAFSRFTGLAMIHPKDHETVYAIAEKKIVQLYGKKVL